MDSPARKPEINLPDPNEAQRRASDPVRSVWVSASAGSGKTKVLTDRLLRLLLPSEEGAGTPPHKILCLTFTKAGASEMALRLSKRLSAWAVIPEERLQADMTSLLGRPPSMEEIKAARRLFAAVTDAPGGLNIMTIHAFCQSVLGRFPLEASLPPHFTALDDGPAKALLLRARDGVLMTGRLDPNSDLGKALTLLSAAQAEDNFDRLLADIVRERRQFREALERHGGLEGLHNAVCLAFGISPGADEQALLLEACRNEMFDHEGLRLACRALAGGTPKTDQPRSVSIQNFLDRLPEPRTALLAEYKKVFLKADGECRQELMTKKLAAQHQQENDILHREAQRLYALEDKIRAAASARLTAALMLAGSMVLDKYERLKEDRAALDFDDLIIRTLDLLQRQDMAGWVMFKLDGGLDHILIDEGQDTNPEQWDIIKALCEDFFAGSGARGETRRTVFCVGDEKQSIYSFQRAAPDKFQAMRTYFADRVQAARKIWWNEELSTSFRSVPSVLRFVDNVFIEESVRQGLGLAKLKHNSFRAGDAGLVELWPLFATPEQDETDLWSPVTRPVDSRSGAALLAEHIGHTVKAWLDNGERLESKGRPLQPGDIMILVRRRNAFVNQMIRALKTRNVPVTGLDRMVLKEQLAVQDLLAAAGFALLPQDDLTLACLLKSPLIGWDDARIEEIAWPRGKNQPLWEALQQNGDQNLLPYLENLIRHAGSGQPYEFFSRILHEKCPADAISGLHALTARLGQDVLDPLDELLNAALAYEAADIAALQGFLFSLERGESEIKREQEEAGGQVRIMTIHGAKGLQAPVVILPDTIRHARGGGAQGQRLIWPDKSGLDVPLWSPRKETDSNVYASLQNRMLEKQDEEYRRLLYVALTRAEDRLYIGGYTGKRPGTDESWYQYMARSFARLPDSESRPFASPYYPEGIEPPQTLRLSNPQLRPVAAAHENAKATQRDATMPPGWLYAPPAAEPFPPRPLAPSRPDGNEPAARSPLAGPEDTYRFRRGTVTHKLLQILPGLPDASRAQAAQGFTALHASDLPASVQADIVRETMALIDNPDFAPLFGPGSLAEVPLTGMTGSRLVSGQIDRLLVTDHEIWIIDYKTNRPPPEHDKDVPALYRQQMSTYSDILARIYPGRKIRSFLLWTDSCRLMEIVAQSDKVAAV